MSSRGFLPTNGPRKKSDMNTTKDVLDHHLQCFAERDLNGTLSDYAPAAVLFTPGGPLVGTDAIRPFFARLIAEFAEPGASFNLKHQSIEGDYAYIHWTAETADNVYELGTDTFVVRNGKIVVQSFAGKISSRG
jgi:ketosteroid isomerase-like protein